MIKAVIYDMDDLMVDSYPLHAMATEQLLKCFNHKLSDLPEELRSKFVGMRVIDICQEIISALKLKTDLGIFREKRSKLFMEIVKNKLEAMPGLFESLELFKVNQYKIALASSGTRRYIDFVLDRFNLRDYFTVIVSGDCVKIGKPHPETYLVASEKLGCQPEECVVFEDAKNGIESAKSAGCRCIAIINLKTPPQDRSGADLILNSLKELTMEMVNSLR